MIWTTKVLGLKYPGTTYKQNSFQNIYYAAVYYINFKKLNLSLGVKVATNGPERPPAN